MLTLCVSDLGDSRAKPWTILLHILGVKITKGVANGGPQRVDKWMWSYVRFYLNDVKQPIVTNIQIWGVTGPNILQDPQGWFWSFGHLSALKQVVRRLRTLLTKDFIPRSFLTVLLIELRLTLRLCASFDIGWLESDFNVLFSPAEIFLVLFRSQRGLCWLLWILPSTSKAARTR